MIPTPPAAVRPLLKGAVSRRLTEDCVLRSKTYEVNEVSAPPVGRDDPGAPFYPAYRFGGPRSSRPTKVLETLLISYISPAAKYNPPPQCAHWGTSFHWIAVSGSAAYGYRVPLAGKRRLWPCGGHKMRNAPIHENRDGSAQVDAPPVTGRRAPGWGSCPRANPDRPGPSRESTARRWPHW